MKNQNIGLRLIIMNFLEFAAWGAYLTSMGSFLARSGFGPQIWLFFATQGFVSIFMPALMGIVADKWIPAQKVLSICQGVAGVFPWSAIIIVLCKELIMFLGGLFMLSQDVVVYSNIVGKATQVCFIISLLLSFFHKELAEQGLPLDIILLWVTVGLAIVAMLIYGVQALRYLRSRKQNQNSGQNQHQA